MSHSMLNRCSRGFRPLPLTACLAAALGLSMTSARSQSVASHSASTVAHDASLSVPVKHARAHAKQNPVPSTPHTVDTCLDDYSSGSLRTLLAGASDGDTIDLAHLPPMGCSKITLLNGQIDIPQNNMYFVGPGKELLTIDADAQSRVFHHTGNGELHISGLTITNGKYLSDITPKGGCIFSNKDVSLVASAVTECAAGGGGSVVATGGGIYAAGRLDMKDSSVTYATAKSIGSAGASGGGVAAAMLDLSGSTLAYNFLTANTYTYGGGAYLLGIYAHIAGSTISNNDAFSGGGFFSYAQNAVVQIENSTISGNKAQVVGGILVGPSGLEIDNSTIAFNRAVTGNAAGVNAGGTLKLRSSIIADNRNATGASDLGGAIFTVSGDHNLVTSVGTGITLPDGTVTSCPHLLPLANNGGTTLTHDLMHDSPAIDVGSNPLNLMLDQTLGPRELPIADIGAVEWNGGSDDRISIDGFDGLCDQ